VSPRKSSTDYDKAKDAGSDQRWGDQMVASVVYPEIETAAEFEDEVDGQGQDERSDRCDDDESRGAPLDAREDRR
jgi:hypothetical protein